MNRYESKLATLRKKNKLLRGYLHKVVGPIDLDNPKITLTIALERRDKESVQLDSVFCACQKCCGNFEDKGVQIIHANLNLLHRVQANVDKLISIVIQDFGLNDEVYT